MDRLIDDITSEEITDPCDLEVLNFNAITDERLRTATRESVQTGKITPLLKEELKCRILSRCLEEGKELSPERITPVDNNGNKKQKESDSARLERRREQNRRAAKKFRMKRQNVSAVLEEEVESLTATNQKLTQEIEQLQTDKRLLQCMLSAHVCARESPLPDISSLDAQSRPLSAPDFSQADFMTM